MSVIIPADSILFGDGSTIEINFPNLTFTSDTWGISCWVNQSTTGSDMALLSGTDWCLYIDSAGDVAFTYRDTGDVQRTKTSVLSVSGTTDTAVGFVVDETAETITITVDGTDDVLAITTGQEVKSRTWDSALYDNSGLTAGIYLDGAVWSIIARDYNTDIDRFYPMNEGSGQILNDKRNADGSELLTNGDFDEDIDWTKGTDWTIAGGVATHANGTGSSLEQAVTVTAGSSYLATFTVSNYVAGSVTPRLTGGSTVAGTAVSADGTYYQVLKAASGNTDFDLLASSDGDYDIDDVSLKLTYKGYAPDADDNDWVTA